MRDYSKTGIPVVVDRDVVVVGGVDRNVEVIRDVVVVDATVL